MNTALHRLRSFTADPIRRRFSYLVILLFAGLFDYVLTNRTARSFEYLPLTRRASVIERRFLPRAFSQEAAIGRYVAEYLLGPTDIDSASLFDKSTALRSILVREGIAHVDLTAEAAFPAEEGVDLRASLVILIAGIERNFPSIKRAKVYIEGHEPFAVPVSETSPEQSASKKGKSVDK